MDDGQHDARSDDGGIPVQWMIGTTVLMAAGALGMLEARRRQQLRASTVRSRLRRPTEMATRVETALRRLDATDRAVRIDVALRAVSSRLAPLGRHVVALMLEDDGTLTLALDAGADAAAPWTSIGDGLRWCLPASVDTVALAEEARRAAQPCPALVQLGRTVAEPDGRGAELLVDLEAIGLLCIDGKHVGEHVAVAALIRAIVATLATSPLAESARTITVGIDDRCGFDNPNVESADSLDAALDAAARHLGSVPSVTRDRRTFALRASGDGRGEVWEPVIVVSAGEPPDAATADDVVQLSSASGRGLGVVIDQPIPGARWFLRPVNAMATGSPTWRLDPLGIELMPTGLDAEALAAVHDLLEEAGRPLAVSSAEAPAAVPAATSRVNDSKADADPFVEQPWHLLVRVLGGVAVVDRTGAPVRFARSKSLELVAWLALHRDRPTRTAARTALWELDVRAPTFANVVSEARRGMARVVPPPDGEEWIERTLTEQLPLHHLVVSDAELLGARVRAARGRPAAEAIEILRPGLELVADLPFSGTGYLWPDAEGISSALTLLATSAAIELARHQLAAGDIDGVFAATGHGLKVLPGHEELIALRMRAYACRGDLAGVRGEWEVYERALHADPWSGAEPSAKLVAVRRELLSR